MLLESISRESNKFSEENISLMKAATQQMKLVRNGRLSGSKLCLQPMKRLFQDVNLLYLYLVNLDLISMKIRCITFQQDVHVFWTQT